MILFGNNETIFNNICIDDINLHFYDLIFLTCDDYIMEYWNINCKYIE